MVKKISLLSLLGFGISKIQQSNVIARIATKPQEIFIKAESIDEIREINDLNKSLNPWV